MLLFITEPISTKEGLMSLYVRDLIERVLSTYIQTFLGLLLASGFAVDGVVDLSLVAKAGVASLPATLSLVKGLLARGVGDSGSASLTVGTTATA